MINKITLLNLVGIIEIAARSHESVSHFGTGEIFEISSSGAETAVNVWLEQPFQRRTKKSAQSQFLREYDLAILVLDQTLDGEGDELEILSKCDLIADWIALYLEENHSDDLTVVGEWNILSLTEYNDDVWAGVRMEIKIQTRLPIDGCDLKVSN